MKILLRILTISLLITVFAQPVYAMTLENIASVLNSTFDVNFTVKQIKSLSKNDRSKLEVIAKKLYLVSPQRKIDREEALKVIGKIAEALTPTDPLLHGIETALISLVGKAGEVVEIGEIGQAAGLTYMLYKILESDSNMPRGAAESLTQVYIGERNQGSSHEEVWNKWFPFYTGIYKENVNPELEGKVKNTFEAYQLTLKKEEWKTVRETVILPIFERAKKGEEQPVGFLSGLWQTVTNLLNSLKTAYTNIKEFLTGTTSQKDETKIKPSDLGGQISNTIPDKQVAAKPVTETKQKESQQPPGAKQEKGQQTNPSSLSSEKVVRVIANKISVLGLNRLGEPPLGPSVGATIDGPSTPQTWHNIGGDGGTNDIFLKRGDIIKYISEQKSGILNPLVSIPQATRVFEVELLSGKRGWIIGEWHYYKWGYTTESESVVLAEIIASSDAQKTLPPIPLFVKIEGRWSGTWKDDTNSSSGSFELQIENEVDNFFVGKGSEIMNGQTNSFTFGGSIFSNKIFFYKYYPDRKIYYEGTASGNSASGDWRYSFSSGTWSMTKTD